MCLILFAYKSHPDYDLILAANRDEFYQRPTAAAQFWDDAPQILAGRDLEKMGTWMGVSKTGRFAALTNYRDPQEMTAEKRSRGFLVADFLKGDEEATAYLQKAANTRSLYPGYNLLVGEQGELFYYSNISDKWQRLTPGIYGLSNHLLNTSWPKVEKGKAGLQAIVDEKATRNRGEKGELVEKLFALLQNAEQAPDASLPNTGVPLELERMLSSMFIASDDYGTRCSTVLLIGGHDVNYVERTYSKAGTSDQNYAFTIENGE